MPHDAGRSRPNALSGSEQVNAPLISATASQSQYDTFPSDASPNGLIGNNTTNNTTKGLPGKRHPNSNMSKTDLDTTVTHGGDLEASWSRHQDHEGDFVTALENNNLARGLRQRHIQMIAIAGAIGTGLFLGLGGSIQTGGPLGAL